MKLKKGAKRIIIVLTILLIVGISILVYANFFQTKKTTQTATVVNEIKEYGYTLKSNKSKAYKDKFQELQKILKAATVDEEAYVKKISEMFILDFYSLNNKVANTDVGGIDFVHSSAQNNFLEKAENTIYKYVQNNMYNNRKQDLPEVDKITIGEVTHISYTALESLDDEAYQVEVSWTYKEKNDYQTKATLIFVHEDKKLALVEMK